MLPSGQYASSALSWLLLLAPLFPGSPSVGEAKSTRPAPLGPNALAHPQRIGIRIIQRNEAGPEKQVRRRTKRAKSATAAGLSEASSPSPPRWDDRFLLSFIGHDDEPITLSLRPSANLVPADGIRSVQRWRDDITGEWKSAESVLAREAVTAYEGWVLDQDDDVDRWTREEAAGVVRAGDAGRGWARIVVTEASDPAQDAPLRFQGSYSIGDEMYTVHPTERYLRTRDPLDPTPPRLLVRRKRTVANETDLPLYEQAYPPMVIVRDHDVMSEEQRTLALIKRGLPTSFGESATGPSCSHDQLAFNIDPAHPVYVNSHPMANATTPWFPFSPFADLGGDAFTPADLSIAPARRAYSPRGHVRYKRQGNDISGSNGQSSNFINSIGSTQGCPKQQKVVFVGVAADCTYVSPIQRLHGQRWIDLLLVTAGPGLQLAGGCPREDPDRLQQRFRSLPAFLQRLARYAIVQSRSQTSGVD